MDTEGYGYGTADRGPARLMDDLRALSPSGIERAAAGWVKHASGAALLRFRRAEKAALHAVEAADRGEEWELLRRTVLDMTESRGSLASWRQEHGETGHRAERAALAASLALVAGPGLERAEATLLVQPMGEALPWLLGEVSRLRA